jgi:predicted N-acetyltransferase YhbS
MAVHADHRGTGCGRAMIDACVRDLVAEGVAFLLVKTISDRDPDVGYGETRAFYRAMGFVPIADLDIWGPEDPALLYVRPL